MSRCIIIGNESLALACARVLEREGHEVAAFVADEGTPAARVRGAGLPVLTSIPELRSASLPDIDFLFSITNLRILPSDVLRLARVAAINYHDGPLPRYSGLNAPVFALLSGETEHGISWHLMEKGADEGGVLRQAVFSIGPSDSALTLNTRCFEAALHEFEALVAALPALPSPRHAPLDASTHCARGRRPRGGAVIDWTAPAAEIVRLVTSLDHGGYPNPVGSATSFLGSGVFLVLRAAGLPGPTGAEPGMVTDLEGGGLTVATGDGRLRILQAASAEGHPLDTDALARLGIAVGTKLESPGAGVPARLDDVHGQVGKHEEFWMRRLEGLDPAELPGIGRAVDDPLLVRHEVELPPALTEPLALASTLAWLCRATGKEVSDVGLVHEVLDQMRVGVERWFAPVVPWRISSKDGETIGEFEARVATELSTLRPRGTWAIDAATRAHGLKPAPAPHFDIVIRLGADRPAKGAALTCAFHDGQLTWWVDSRRVSHALVVRLREQFLTLAASAQDLRARVSDLPVVPPDERTLVLHTWNATATPWPSEKLVHEIIREQVERSPEVVATIFDGEPVTYRELDRRAEVLAHRLRMLGVGPDTIVGLHVQRSVRLVVGVLGILKAGGAYLPLDPGYPAERLDYMVADADVRIIVSERDLEPGLGSAERTLVYLDEEMPAITGSNGPPARPENLAYVIYTSGSTGRPKGVMIEHRNVVNFFVGMDARIGTDRGVWLAVTSLSFDISVLELLWTLARGFTVVIYREPDRRATATDNRAGTGYAIPHLTRVHGVTHLQCTPSTIMMLLLEDGAREALRQLRRLLVGGEALPAALANELVDLVAGEVHNMYGPTETTVWSTSHLLEASSTAPALGRPIANTLVLVLDERRRLVPIGTPGELHIGGDGVVRGYLKRPELTAERFITSPLAQGGRLYRTGDMVRWREDGVLEFIGRADSQVKLRGHRIELGEIEQHLRQASGVLDAVAIVREDTPGDKRLVAYVVPRAEARVDPAELRDQLKALMPEYMMPSHIVPISAIPLTPNRKVDRKALPPPATVTAHSAGAPARPGVETELANIWSDLLGVPLPGREANFFDLGGHSLLAMQVHSRLRAGHPERSLTVTDLFRFPTIAALGALLTAEKDDPAEVRHSHARPEPVYFGIDGRLQFGILHRAHRLPVRGAILCCYPMPPEYMFCYRAFQRLAVCLAQEGFDVLRFDYTGIGDSAGEPGDATIEGWASEVETALDYLRLRTEATRISIVGMRLGAALAAKAAIRAGAADRLVLWEPVGSGADYVEELARLAGHASLPPGAFDICGFPVTMRLRTGLVRIVTTATPSRASRTLVLESSPSARTTMANSGDPGWSHEIVPGLDWSRALVDDMVVVPPAHLERIIHFLTIA